MKLRYIFALVGILSLSIASVASASTYTNSDQSFALSLDEIKGSNNFYFRNSGNRNFVGLIKIIKTSKTADRVTYDGTFQEDLMGEITRPISCVGPITIVRQKSGNQVQAKLTQVAKSGKNCPSIGQTFKITLVEPLPIPDKNGNFTPQNSDTNLSQTSGFLTWTAWQVASSDGELNCREKPDPKSTIKFVYRTGDRIRVEGRGDSAFRLTNGSSWMHTASPKGRCYVRANSTFIKPVSIPY